MKSPKIIMITSCKGGVGKSTVCANLAAALAFAGSRSLAVDLDFGMRCLDLIFGLESEVVHDIRDAAQGKSPPAKVCVTHPVIPGLYFCAAPFGGDFDITPEETRSALSVMAELLSLDFILLDTPGDMGGATRLAAEIADSACIISGAQPSSIRGAGRTGELLASLGLDAQKLIINSFDMKGAALTRRGERPGVTAIIDRTCIPLLGVVPADKRLALLQEKGVLAAGDRRCAAARAFDNIARRMTGGSVPLFAGIHCRRRQILL